MAFCKFCGAEIINFAQNVAKKQMITLISELVLINTILEALGINYIKSLLIKMLIKMYY